MYLNVSGDFAFNQELFRISCLISQTIGTVLNLFTLFVVYYYNPPELASYKWHLFVYQACSTFLDFAMDTLAKPIFFFPYMAGTSTGWFHTVFNLHTFLIYVLMMTLGGLCLHFICFSPLFFRWQTLLDDSSVFKLTVRGRYKFQIIDCTLSSICLIVFLSLPYQPTEKVSAEFAQRYQNDAFLTEIEGFYIVNSWTQPTTFIGSNLCILLWLLFLILSVIYASVDCLRILDKSRSHMSDRTRQMHFRFLKNLFFQTSVPMLLLEIPVLLWLVMMATDLRFPGHQDFNNFLVWCTCVHGAFGSIFVFYLNPLYTKSLKKSLFGTLSKHFPHQVSNITTSTVVTPISIGTSSEIAN